MSGEQFPPEEHHEESFASSQSNLDEQEPHEVFKHDPQRAREAGRKGGGRTVNNFDIDTEGNEAD